MSPRPRPKTKKRRRYGLSARDFPANCRSKLEVDYLHLLSPSELDWLADFNERHIGASFPAHADEWTTEMRRETYNAKNSINRDLYSVHEVVGLLEFPTLPIAKPDPTPTRDWTQTPAHLQSQAYKEILQELRAAIDVARKVVARDVDKKAAANAAVATIRRKLERLAALTP